MGVGVKVAVADGVRLAGAAVGDVVTTASAAGAGDDAGGPGSQAHPAISRAASRAMIWRERRYIPMFLTMKMGKAGYLTPVPGCSDQWPSYHHTTAPQRATGPVYRQPATKGSHVSWERGQLARGDATRAGRPRSRARGLPRVGTVIPGGIGNPAWSCASPQLDSSIQGFGELESCGGVELSQCDAIKENSV